MVVPFEPWHLLWLTETTERLTQLDPGQARDLKGGGPCFTALAGSSVIACAGVIHYWEGRVHAWSLLSPQVADYTLGVHRRVARFLRDYPARRIECTIDPRSPVAQEWARRLGFEYEGTMPGYLPSGSTMELWAMVKVWPKP